LDLSILRYICFTKTTCISLLLGLDTTVTCKICNSKITVKQILNFLTKYTLLCHLSNPSSPMQIVIHNKIIVITTRYLFLSYIFEVCLLLYQMLWTKYSKYHDKLEYTQCTPNMNMVTTLKVIIEMIYQITHYALGYPPPNNPSTHTHTHTHIYIQIMNSRVQ